MNGSEAYKAISLFESLLDGCPYMSGDLRICSSLHLYCRSSSPTENGPNPKAKISLYCKTLKYA